MCEQPRTFSTSGYCDQEVRSRARIALRGTECDVAFGDGVGELKLRKLFNFNAEVCGWN